MNGMDTVGEWDSERNCYVVHQVHMAWKGYQAAIKAERERCADICERLVRDNSDAGECADAIRNRESSTPKEE